MYYSNGKLAVAQVPKAGIQTISEWLGREFQVVDNEAAKQADLRIWFIRNPIERMKSAYSFFHFKAQHEPRVYRMYPAHDWHTFVDHMLSVDDTHWRPQHIHAGDAPNRIHRFENIHGYMDQYHPGILPHRNRMTRMPTDDYRADDIAEFCAEDMKVWLTA